MLSNVFIVRILRILSLFFLILIKFFQIKFVIFSLLATSSADGTAKIWRTIDFSLLTECKDTNQRWVWDLAFTCDSKYLFTASSDKLARLWSVQTGEIKKDYTGHQKLVVCIAFSDTKIMQ